MPIKNLTNRQPQFPEIGQLRKGEEKTGNRPGKDLTYFRFTSDIPEVLATFEEHYNGEPRLINVLLPYQYVDGKEQTDGTWNAWNEHWVAGGLKHRCDGEFVVRQQNGDGTYTDPEPGTVPCPGKCTPAGYLKVVIPEFKRLAYVTVLTGSKHDIANLDAQLRALEAIRHDLRGIPLQLRRRKKKISTPGTNGQRVRREKWLLSIEAAPSWVELQLAAQEAAAIPQLPQPDAPVVPNGAVMVNGATGEVLDGDTDTAQDNGPDWEDVPDQDAAPSPEQPEEEFEPPPDFLLAEIPTGKYAGKAMGEMLELDFNYLQWVSTSAKNEDLKKCAQASIAWQKEMQPELFSHAA